MRMHSDKKIVDFLFWSSLLLTLPTPLSRIVRGRWASTGCTFWFKSLLPPTKDYINATDSFIYSDESFVYEKKGIDFALRHACFFWPPLGRSHMDTDESLATPNIMAQGTRNSGRVCVPSTCVKLCTHPVV